LSLLPLASDRLLAAHASGSAPLLPNLVADPPDGVELVTSNVENESRLLLRFNGYVHNAGPGALDFRGSRARPQVIGMSETQLHNELQAYKAREESLPQKLEEELAAPAMEVDQRLFTTNGGDPANSEAYLNRPHVEEASAAELSYSDADGHHHWHLQHVAKYSLWNASRTAEVAPAQKVGFCLSDSQHVEPDVGPSTPVYANDSPPYEGFCRRFEPNATSVYEGISPGWRDVYGNELAFQWVDASNVLPGEYWLREDIDPTNLIKQAGGGTKLAYAASATIIPGFDAEAESASTGEDQPTQIDLTSRSYAEQATPVYAIASEPQHGTLGEVDGDTVTYTPDPGYSGTDSFAFSAHNPNSQFPENPGVATVSISVAAAQPSISISGVQAEMTAGTSAALSASVVDDFGGVEWEASAGTLTTEGLGEQQVIYSAPATPPAGGTVTVTARLRDDHAINAERTITVKPLVPSVPAPELPSAEGVPASGASGGSEGFRAEQPAPSVSRPRAMLVGRMLVLTTIPGAAGRVRLTAYLGRHALGTCSAETPSRRTFTCRIRIARNISLHSRISVRASLHVSDLPLLQATLPPQRIPEMKMRPMTQSGRIASANGIFRCSPSTLVGVLVAARDSTREPKG
jgi:hypothetical protein